MLLTYFGFHQATGLENSWGSYTRILTPALCSAQTQARGLSPEPATGSPSPGGEGSKMCTYSGPEEDLEEGQAGTVRVAKCGTEDRLKHICD